MTCTSWFTESGETVCFVDDCGGDDIPDGTIIPDDDDDEGAIIDWEHMADEHSTYEHERPDEQPHPHQGEWFSTSRDE